MEPRAAVLQASFDLAHLVFNAVVNDLDGEMGLYRLPGGMVPSAAAIIAHAVFGEDMMVGEASESPRVLESQGFSIRTGILEPSPAMTPEWLGMDFDLAGLKGYAEAVFARTSEFLQSATAAQLDRRIATPIGREMSAAEYLGGFGVVHIAEHAGEVSALKGAQGLKGLPF